jgi:CO dehydrogenase/acetyl-CoA synthase alpha subunit
MSTFFQETCKILGTRKVNTTSYHPSSNGIIERLHKTLHTGLSYFVNSGHNLDVLVPFFVMAYGGTPNTLLNTAHSIFYTEEKCRYLLMQI